MDQASGFQTLRLSRRTSGRPVDLLLWLFGPAVDCRVYEKDARFLEFLEGLHLRPSTTVEVLKREYDETMTLAVGNRTIHLGKPATSRIWVRALTS